MKHGLIEHQRHESSAGAGDAVPEGGGRFPSRIPSLPLRGRDLPPMARMTRVAWVVPWGMVNRERTLGFRLDRISC